MLLRGEIFEELLSAQAFPNSANGVLSSNGNKRRWNGGSPVEFERETEVERFRTGNGGGLLGLLSGSSAPINANPFFAISGTTLVLARTNFRGIAERTWVPIVRTAFLAHMGPNSANGVLSSGINGGGTTGLLGLLSGSSAHTARQILHSSLLCRIFGSVLVERMVCLSRAFGSSWGEEDVMVFWVHCGGFWVQAMILRNFVRKFFELCSPGAEERGSCSGLILGEYFIKRVDGEIRSE